LTNPSVCGISLTPSSAAPASLDAGLSGTRLPNSEVEPVSASVREAVAPMFALSSVARTLIVTAPSPVTVPAYDQFAVPEAGCQVRPLSSETSTPATTPPLSAAVPETVTFAPLAAEAPAAGDVTVAVGPVASVDAVAATSPLIRVAGCTFMSASRFTVACCIRGSAGSTGLKVLSWLASRPQANWTVPAPNTRAPLAAR
jgi:hypothetical protein